MNLDEALEKIDELKETISDLETDNQELEQRAESAEGDASGFEDELCEAIENKVDIEEVTEKAFYSGYKSGANSEFVLQGWLNYKIEARL